MLLPLGQCEPIAGNTDEEPDEPARLLERIALLLQNLPVRSQVCYQQRLRVAECKVPNQRRVRPAAHPRHKRLVGTVTLDLVDDLAQDEVVVLADQFKSPPSTVLSKRTGATYCWSWKVPKRGEIVWVDKRMVKCVSNKVQNVKAEYSTKKLCIE